MDKYIDRFPEQMLEALEIGKTIPPMKFNFPINNIVISGMGGSGIGGAIIKGYTSVALKVPIEVINDYTLPAYINENTLVICSSYSGNTEETLSAFTHATDKKCNIICITSGGELKNLADTHKCFAAIIPGGHPPRTCLGYSLTMLLFILYQSGFIEKSFIGQLEKAAQILKSLKTEIQEESKSIADKIQGTIPLIYSSPKYSAIAIRYKQQLNENAKTFAFVNIIPEMNHNELLAYYNENKNISVVYLRDVKEPEQIKKRFELSAKLIQPKVHCLLNIFSTGESYLEKIFYLIHIGDWISYYLSEINQVDPIEIEMLDWLKKELENK